MPVVNRLGPVGKFFALASLGVAAFGGSSCLVERKLAQEKEIVKQGVLEKEREIRGEIARKEKEYRAELEQKEYQVRRLLESGLEAYQKDQQRIKVLEEKVERLEAQSQNNNHVVRPN